MSNQPNAPADGRNGRWVNLGEVGVDGAAIGISDPAFVPREWSMPKGDGPQRSSKFGSGVQFWAGFGDGGYDVWAWVVDYGEGDEVDERIAQVVITMIDDDELAAWRAG
jgi:hypothetical protein